MTEWRTVERPSTLSVQPRAQVVGDIPDAHVITVRERRVTVDYPTIIQNNVNTDVIELDLDGEWDNMSVVLVLGPCGGATELAWHGEPVTLPSALAGRGEHLRGRRRQGSGMERRVQVQEGRRRHVARGRPRVLVQ